MHSALKKIDLCKNSLQHCRMRIAVEGCCHGALDEIYETLRIAEEDHGFKVSY